MARSMTHRRMVWKPTSTSTVETSAVMPTAVAKIYSDPGEDVKSLGDGGSTRADESDSERSELSGPGCSEEPTTSTPAERKAAPMERKADAFQVYERAALLRMRGRAHALAVEPPADRLRTEPLPPEQRSAQPAPARSPSPRPRPAALTASPPPSPSLTLNASPNSWAAARQRRQQEGNNEQALMERSVRSILNKLTLEKFEELYQKLLLSIAGLMDHVDVLAGEIFKKATVQHNFTAMYADLCARLDADLNLNCDGPGGMRFRAAILTQCRQLFEASWTPLAASDSAADVDQEAEAEAEVLRKKATLGNLRFIGEILVRGLVPPSELFIIAEDLRQAPVVPEKIEALATLLTVAGPVLDTEAWECHDQLKVVFWDIRGLTFSPEIPTRIRCLLRDLLDLRDAGWVDTKVATRDQGPKGLKQLRSEAAAESSRSPKLKPSPEATAMPSGPAREMWSAKEAAAVYCQDAGSTKGAWSSSEAHRQAMGPGFDESWGCGTYMVFVPMEMLDASWEATDMSMPMMSAYA